VSPLANLPNAVTLGGYAATLAWIAGGSPWLAAIGLFADEADGPIARKLGQTSDFGSLLDWAVDVALATAIAVKLGGVWLLAAPFVIAGQTYLRLEGRAPAFGSARAFLTCVAVWR